MAEEAPGGHLSAASAVVRNPLSVIAMFVLLVEAIATVTLVNVANVAHIAIPLVWFVVGFPTLIAILFFATLWWRHQFLYSPMEYRSDESFLSAMQRLQRVEARQEAADLNPKTAGEEQSISVVDRLLALGDVRAAVKVGRTFLEAGQFEPAKRIFEHILGKTPRTHEDRYNALSNLGYAEIGLGRYAEAIKQLDEAVSILGEARAGPWHRLALAYAHFRLSANPKDAHHKAFEKQLAAAKAHRWFNYNRDFFSTLYPEIADKL
ncbi:tetratricopeptide repeat protein [Phenylobacterium sp.]|uniref:tetratricopeptide repeat protein n=1 Tax=Phenylobacterium sp. TaxID=1871053 RepID=UPI002EDA2449